MLTEGVQTGKSSKLTETQVQNQTTDKDSEKDKSDGSKSMGQKRNLTAPSFTKVPKMTIPAQKFPCYIPKANKKVGA